MEIQRKKKEWGFKNRLIVYYFNDAFCLLPVIDFVYENVYEYISSYESISIVIQFAFFGIKFEHKYNIRHE